MHWGRSGLNGAGDVEEGFGVVSKCETEKIYLFLKGICLLLRVCVFMGDP